MPYFVLNCSAKRLAAFWNNLFQDITMAIEIGQLFIFVPYGKRDGRVAHVRIQRMGWGVRGVFSKCNNFFMEMTTKKANNIRGGKPFGSLFTTISRDRLCHAFWSPTGSLLKFFRLQAVPFWLPFVFFMFHFNPFGLSWAPFGWLLLTLGTLLIEILNFSKMSRHFHGLARLVNNTQGVSCSVWHHY